MLTPSAPGAHAPGSVPPATPAYGTSNYYQPPQEKASYGAPAPQYQPPEQQPTTIVVQQEEERKKGKFGKYGSQVSTWAKWEICVRSAY